MVEILSKVEKLVYRIKNRTLINDMQCFLYLGILVGVRSLMYVAIGSSAIHHRQLSAMFDLLSDQVLLRPNEVIKTVDPRSVDIRSGFVEATSELKSGLNTEHRAKIEKILDMNLACDLARTLNPSYRNMSIS